MERVTGYFTVERNIVGLSLAEMESKLGFRPGLLTKGARVLVLLRQPVVGEFAFAGSTRYSDAKGLVDVELRRRVEVPHAWARQRLVKVEAVPKLTDFSPELFPSATSPIEQWKLLIPIDAKEVCQLRIPQAYWPRG